MRASGGEQAYDEGKVNACKEQTKEAPGGNALWCFLG
jgi:hypothetical protein